MELDIEILDITLNIPRPPSTRRWHPARHSAPEPAPRFSDPAPVRKGSLGLERVIVVVVAVLADFVIP